jgi:signal transduction histidine kinase
MLELQKAEAIGRFTSIIVHDFRNILAVLRAGTSQIRRTGEDERTTWIADAMDDALGRGDRLVNQLLSFARGEASEADSVDLEALLQDCDELIRRSLGEGVRYSWNIDPDARFVMANRDQLELALINLARNASDAMEGKGAFTINSSAQDEKVELRICDSGPGVPKEIRARVFDAFFTTKSAQKGTGLGLAQVAGAVRQVGGELEVDDRPEGGACFRLYLPAGS